MNNKKKRFSLKEEYRKSWNYLKESRKFIYAVVWIFLIFVLIGFFVPFPQIIIEKISEYIKELLNQTQGLNQFEMTKFIFFNNIKSSFFGMILGVFLGIFPILVTVVNGGLLGFVASESVSQEGIFVLWRILPHGIFELPAVFISVGLGLKLGTFIFQKNKSESFRKYFWNSLRVFLFFVIPLLVIAAIIEGWLIFNFG
ncbi:MAG: stage II sporulation protein M [Nanoarchaeota archaeon]|nr:stage II sporulation protein M [Nanoarchaeota archaeon]